jgi:hypothetical protein
MNDKKIARSQFDTVLSFGLISIFTLLAVLLWFYFDVFDGGISKKADSWSAFGSFFGGVFGPIISLVTLFAILRTIELQKHLLITQRHEFEELSSQQMRSHQAQVDQANFSKLSDYKSHQLQLLDQQITMFERMLDRYNAEGARHFELGRKSGVPRTERLIEIDRNIQSTEEQVGKLIQLSVEISLGEFKSIEQLSLKMNKELKDIEPNLFKS